MAQTYTTNLKLILEDNLTSNSKYNLKRIDSLGEVFTVTDSANVEVRSEKKITLRPNAAESGGTGTGGQLDLGLTSQFLDNFYIYADNTSIFGDLELSSLLKLKNGSYSVSLNAPTLSQNVNFTLPSQDGTSGQALATDGNGQLNWIDPSGKSSSVFTWAQADGATKLINHNFDSSSITVDIYDNSTGTPIFIEDIDYINSNTVQLTALEAPPAAGYSVYITEY